MRAQLEVEKLRVVQRRPDGSGVIEIPVAVPSLIDLGRTASGSTKSIDLTPESLAQIVENFAKRPGPKPAYFGHISDKARETQEADGFVEAAFIENGKLWNRVDLNSDSFHKVVTKRGFRSASVEIDRDKGFPTVQLKGWSQGGLAITNTPALDVEYVAAGQNADAHERTVRLSTLVAYEADEAEERSMTIEQLQAEKAALERKAQENDTARAQLAQKVTELEAQLAAARTKGDEVAGLKASLDAMKAEQEKATKALASRDARDAIQAALSAGKLLPAQVEGWKDDPSAAIAKLGFSGVDGFNAFLKNAPVVVKLATPGSSSGQPQANDAADAQAKLTAETNKVAAEKGIAFHEAMKLVAKTQPDLYREATSETVYPAPGFVDVR